MSTGTPSGTGGAPTAGADAAPPPDPRDEVLSHLIDALDTSGTPEQKEVLNGVIGKYLTGIAAKIPVSKNYNVVVHYDDSSIVSTDADHIYSAVTSFADKKKPLLVVLYSDGGSLSAAYLIGKLCREYCNGKLVVVIPRRAKSAATLIACAADQLHMGSLSELGPIDPQIEKLPALGLKNAVEHIAELVTERPGSSEMFARYLSMNLPLINLGYYERVAESARDYATRLLSMRTTTSPNAAAQIATTLVYDYKDHNFVIDKTEAAKIFGDANVKTATEEYELGNVLYQALKEIERWAGVFSYDFYLIGCLTSRGIFNKRSSKS
ncbi:MAG TPA: hypothetical protein VHE81_21760 [Lacipirellulaceae bacterium]|nr:hypothetical protein [Lacipirellulaceae bacterium]